MVALGFRRRCPEDSRGARRSRDGAGAERDHERVELTMVFDASEALGGADEAEPDPPPPHVAIAPALDVPRDVPQRADQILDAIRRREEAVLFLGYRVGVCSSHSH